MRAFSIAHGINIYKECASIPGISMSFLLRGALLRNGAPELYAPEKEVYDMLKASVTGDPSNLFTRFH